MSQPVQQLKMKSINSWIILRSPLTAPISSHSCWANGNQPILKKASALMHEKVREDPTGSVKKIYEDVRNQVTAGLDQQQKDSLLQEFPKYCNMSANLYKTRQEKIPAAPTEMKDLDVELDWFRFSTGEMVVKGDELFDDGKRILLFSSVAHLELLARAKQILGDGTFKITPTTLISIN